MGDQAMISQFNLLKVKSDYVYQCRRSQDWLDCRLTTEEPVSNADAAEHLVEQANNLGGFIVPMNPIHVR